MKLVIKKYLKLLVSVCGFISIDQIVKTWMAQYHPSLISVNSGVFFGLVENFYFKYLFIIIGLILLLWLIYKNQQSAISNQLSVALIVAGALSNIIDRLIHGYIIDYIKLPSLLSFWPTFNLADVFIVAGVLIYLYQLFHHKT